MKELLESSFFNLETMVIFATIIGIAILIGISFAVKLIRSIMPYPSYGGMSSGGYSRPESDNSISLLTILLFSAIIFFAFYLNKHLDSNEPKLPPQERVKQEKASTHSSKEIAPPTKTPAIPKGEKPPFSIEDTHTPSRQRYNRSPRQNQAIPLPPSAPLPQEVTRYGIQILALSTLEAAERKAPARAGHHQCYILEDQDGLYKAIIGSFDTPEEARAFGQRNALESKMVKEYVLMLAR